MIAEGGYLVTDAFEGIGEPTPIDEQTPRDGVAFWLIAYEMDIHGLFFVAVVVVNTDERATESEDFAEDDEYGVVNLADRMRDEPTREQCAPESAHCGSDDEL